MTGPGTAAGHGPAPESGVLITHAETVMGTVVSFAAVTGDVPEPMARAAIRSGCAVLHAADATFSTWKPDSPLSRLRRGEISLRRAGLPAALVNGGGDLACYGMPAPGRRWRVGIQHPCRRDALACIIEVESAVATSGTYERGAHLIDPETGRPGARAMSATVTGPRLALADAFATAVAVGGDEALAAVTGLERYEGYLIRPDGSETDTGGMTFVHTEPASARDPLS